MASLACALIAGLLLAWATAPVAADLYRYKDESGRWVFSDRKPPAGQDFEKSARAPTQQKMPRVSIREEGFSGGTRVFARNDCQCPMQVAVWLNSSDNVSSNVDASGATAVLPAGNERLILELRPARAGAPWSYELEHGYVPGDPAAVHAPEQGYLPPFAPATAYRVSQAFPDTATHNTLDSRHAVDIAMPEGAGVYAARGGLVVAVAYANFTGGTDREKFGRRANQIRILHDDGTFAVYAHLAWDSIRVRPGERVVRGEQIAASGNTGFSTGPHLHFAVLRNAGLQSESLPVEFSDGRGQQFVARTGMEIANP